MPPDSTYEQGLLRLAQSGDADAFAVLQALLQTPARQFTRRLIGVVDDDIVQEAMFALYMNLERIDPPQKLRPFLYRVIRNRCYDRLRAEGRFEVVSLDEESWGEAREAQIASDAPTPDETTHWLMLYTEVQAAMLKLPELQRQALILFSEAGMSYEEIADAMSVSIGTVKSRIFYAKRTLAGLLSPETRQALEAEDNHAQPKSGTGDSTGSEA